MRRWAQTFRCHARRSRGLTAARDEAEVFRLLGPLTPGEVEALAQLIESAVMDMCNCLSVFVVESSQVVHVGSDAPPGAERQGSKKCFGC
jgi:hypothetical protein